MCSQGSKHAKAVRMLRRTMKADLCPGCAGEEAVQYFEHTNPEYPRFGAGSTSDNHAEWIVDLTTKACPCHADTHSSLHGQQHPLP